MQKIIAAAQQFARVHLAAWWPGSRAEEVARQYKVFRETCPLVVADMARRGLAFDNTWVQGDPSKSDFNQGTRAYWLETLALIGIARDDLQSLQTLQQETEIHDED
jgi:hypothetical protein